MRASIVEHNVENEAVATAKSKQALRPLMPPRFWLTFSSRKTEGVKRQRTASASPSPSGDPRRLTSQAADSDDGTNARSGGAKKIRGAAARNHREKELREERERSRLEAKKKREGRAERRRVGMLYSRPDHKFLLSIPSRIRTSRRNATGSAVLSDEEYRSSGFTARSILISSSDTRHAAS